MDFNQHAIHVELDGSECKELTGAHRGGGRPNGSTRSSSAVCSFLALLLKSALDDRIAGLGQTGSWPAILADLDSLTETEIDQDGARFRLRSAPRPAASLALRATGIALPPTVQTVPEV
jgi:hypothetical protein